MQTDAQENKLQEKDSEVLRLLNQIATDMIRKSDVDRLVEEAVAKATAALKADYEERMQIMAAEYETKIAENHNQKSGKGDDNSYDYWSGLIENVGKEGVDLNSFVHNQWQKHNK